MHKRKNSQIDHRHTLAVILMSVFMMMTIRFPLQFVGDLYQWTGNLYISVSLPVIAYAVWIFIVRRSKYLATVLFVITLFTTAFNFTEFRRSHVYGCELASSTDMVCSLAYIVNERVWPDGWVRYLTLEHFPVGIQIDHQPFDLLMLF